MRLPTLLITVLAAGCAAPSPTEYQQAPALRPPLPRPVYVPPPGSPGYVPEAPFSQPRFKETPPRSPHKRLLPPSKEPGLWAGDTQATFEQEDVFRQALDKVAPVSGADHDTMTDAVPKYCRRVVLERVGERQHLLSAHPLLSDKARRCLLAKMMVHCMPLAHNLLAGKEPGVSVEVATKAAKTAEAAKKHACADKDVEKAIKDLVSDMLEGW